EIGIFEVEIKNIPPKIFHEITVKNFSRSLAGSCLPPAFSRRGVSDSEDGARFSAASRNASARLHRRLFRLKHVEKPR
ncbi:MAG: hypothetical protein NTX50_29890, partial [Candidatus Sumerlaeota bacterium]|nr:hypothetical protein [Candidatus Sumerlaeota bacterium]